MTDKKLTTNFKLSEFTKTDPTEYQLTLITILAGEIQKIRDRLQEFKKGTRDVSITITSGVRTQADYDRLKKRGSNPSATSDHFCGLQLTATPTLGAADIQVRNCSMSLKKIAALIIEMDKREEVRLGQIIYEKNPETGSEWIHLGNDWNMIFRDRIPFKRKKYLMSTDNGKTYKTFR